MNVTIRKLAMLEKDIMRKEEEAKTQGFVTPIIDQELKNKISTLMDRIRAV